MTQQKQPTLKDYLEIWMNPKEEISKLVNKKIDRWSFNYFDYALSLKLAVEKNIFNVADHREHSDKLLILNSNHWLEDFLETMAKCIIRMKNEAIDITKTCARCCVSLPSFFSESANLPQWGIIFIEVRLYQGDEFIRLITYKFRVGSEELAKCSIVDNPHYIRMQKFLTKKRQMRYKKIEEKKLIQHKENDAQVIEAKQFINFEKIVLPEENKLEPEQSRQYFPRNRQQPPDTMGNWFFWAVLAIACVAFVLSKKG